MDGLTDSDGQRYIKTEINYFFI